ncbi:MAG: hypothetical protein D6791_18370 [Chloroflexi bacterium]|nr:MAG: hypothetical protein D6791_18370 [Chloroflexota bacterium]
MNGKERVLATLRRQPTDRIPLDCWLFQKHFVEKLEAEYGSRSAFLDAFNIDIFTGFVPFPNQSGRKFDVSDLETYDPGDPRDPMWITFQDWNPDFAGGCIRDAVEQHGHNRAIVAHLWGIVEGTSQIIGIENCWMHLGKSKQRMAAWFDRYADWLCGLVDSCAEAGVDIVTLSDDWGSNQNMLFSPRMWRRQIAPFVRRVVEHAHGRGLFVNLHSDGYIMDIMDDIIDVGFDMLHPVQESAGMDPATVKRDYGDRIVIYGSLDIIEGLRVHDGAALTEYIARRFEIYAPGGGFIFNTAHFVQPDISPQRLIDAYTLANELAQTYGGDGGG